MNTLTEEQKDLIKEAGFKIFGDKIVAADQGQSGLATQSVINLIRMLNHGQNLD